MKAVPVPSVDNNPDRSTRGNGRGGRRERNKRDKLARIKQAARKLFGRQGVEATTIRQIAVAADIGLGTVFSYAANKQDLLVLIFREEVGAAVDSAFAHMPAKALLDQTLHVFDAIIEHHRKNPALARVFVKETPFIADTRHGIADFMGRLFERLTILVDEAKRRGEFRAEVPSEMLARNLFGIFFHHLQMWLGGGCPKPDFDRRWLRARLELQLAGLRIGARPGPPISRETRRK
ncbi:MAG: TetR/AcrR family transcriptional regulator [Candidatus Binataceae bacterium]